MDTPAKQLLDDLRVAVAFLTRLPMPHPDGAVSPNFARAHRLFPLVGAMIGATIGLVYVGLMEINVPPVGAAALSLGVGMLLTGALHEDGLADLADGLGGGRDKAAKLEIMRDSRLGTFGALALLVAFVAKVSALAALPRAAILPSLITAHAVARAPMTIMAMMMPNAREDGLSATAGMLDSATAVTAVVVALAIAFLVLPWAEALGSALTAAMAAFAVGVLAQRQIGGKTGDVLGGAEQVGETAILLLLASLHR